MCSDQTETQCMRASNYSVLLCLILFIGCYLHVAPVFSQPGARPTVNTHPRETTRRTNRKPGIKRPAAPSAISLWVVSNPPNSRVSVNGEPRGETDAGGEMELRMTPGTYAVKVSRDGYITREADVDVLSTPEAQEIEFTLLTAFVTLNVVTDPPGAEVYLDDIYKGATSPTGLLVLEKITPGQPHVLRARKDGYVHQSTPITSYTGQISIKLLPDAISLRVTTDPPEAEVYLDEVYKGTSTSGGMLVIEQVNPNQSHNVRAKKEGYRQQSASLAPGASESTITLSPDPVVLLVRDIKQRVAESRLVEAVASFNQLTRDAPDHQELTRLSESILLAIQSRTTEMLKRVEPYGLAIGAHETQEMSSLYNAARHWRPGDEAIENQSKYWLLRLVLLNAEQAGSLTEKDNLRRSVRPTLLELSESNLRNPYLVLDLGWSWWKLNDRGGAQKQFKAAQELKPDWAYPYFALGFLSMEAAENERAKSMKIAGSSQALENFTKAISLKHDFAVAYALKSIIYSQLKKDEDSIATALQAVAVDPQNASAHFALGYAYFEKGKSQYRGALTEFNKAIALGGTELNEGMKNAIQLRIIRIKKTLK
jgi:hypothetical protein